MAVFIFISKLIISAGLLYGYYHLFLRNKRFHHYNRFYLLAIAVLSLVIPFINIPVNLLWGRQQHSALIQTLQVINANGWEEPVTIYANNNYWSHWINTQNGLWFVYIAGVLTCLFTLVRSLAWIKKLTTKYHYEVVDQLKIYNTAEPGTPFSFFRSIFWDSSIAFNDPKGQQIFRHELFHVKEKHSADVLLMEILCSICWFNPFYHLIKKELKAIHEFLADEYAVSANNRYDYAELLVSHALTQKALQLTNPFFHNQIKRRITMITQSNLIRRSGYISRIMALPLFFLLLSAFAVKIKKNLPATVASNYANKTLTVVIDPGHGGIYPGSRNNNNIVEKDIDLNISKKIKELSANYNVNIVLTRSKDELVGNAANLKEDLENRVNLKTESKADLFISIHVNATPDAVTDMSGFEMYIGKNKNDDKARQLSSAILTELKNIYPVDEVIKQREVGIHVLDQSKCPAVMIQCGYITNPKDVAFITDPVNQEKVAQKILEGIVKYSNAQQVNSMTQKDTVTKVTYTREDKSSADTMMTVTYFTHSKDNNDSTPPKILTKVEFEPGYPGGSAGWVKYLTEHLKYPDAAIKKKIQGTVLMQFIVNTDGTLSDIKVISGPEELRASSIKVIKESGTWISGTQNGKKVRVYKKQPISYKLDA